MTSEAIRVDRAAGVLLGQACGDALGVPYEFRSPPLRDDEQPEMIGGGLGPYAPAEWSDDTQMAICIAEVAATGADLRSVDALDAIAERFLDWRSGGATDIGNQTRQVLDAAARGSGRPAQRMRQASFALHERTGHTAGNGALMRTAPVALAHLGDDEAIAAAARAVAELTHADPLAGDSCVLWCTAIDRAVRERRIDNVVREGLAHIDVSRRAQWEEWLDEADAKPPTTFAPNGFTVRALQAAWSAIVHTPVPVHAPAEGSFDCLHLQQALAAAVRVGDDTDTIAAIAGALLGARWGSSAVPYTWRREVHGWPGLRARDLVRLAVSTVNNASGGWPNAATVDYSHLVPSPVDVVRHPADEGVLLGTANAAFADDVDAVVSLFRLGRDEVPRTDVQPRDHLEYWLVDSDHDNAHPEFVIDDAASAVDALRAEGKRVLLHCVQAERRTPVVAARYGTLRGRPVEESIREVRAALPRPAPAAGTLYDAVRALGQSPPQ